MVSILGISAYFHDSAAALVADGRVVAAVQEERFTRIKHDPSFPRHAVEFCLKEAALKPSDLDGVVFYEKPLLKFERILETYSAFAPFGFLSFLKAMPIWLRQKLFIPREIERGLNNKYEGPIYFTTHHQAHAASAFFPSPFEEAAILTIDGVGEWSSATWGIGEMHRVTLKKQIQFPHSLGLFYSAFTYYAGFRVNSGEYKLMGLAPYGKPKYVDLILDRLIDVKEDGSFWLDQRYFNYCQGLTMTNRKFNQLLGAPPRKPESPITQREMDLAASVQYVTEMVMLRMAHHVYRETGMKNLCMAGGVALNCVGNGRLYQEGPFENIWIQPAAGDAGGALGAALFTWHHIMNQSRHIQSPDGQYGSYLGPSYSNEEITTYLEKVAAPYEIIEDEVELARRVAALLDDEKVVGHFDGRMEFGPRALGARSILGDPRNANIQTTMNLKIKLRESFRPFAPSCLEEKVSDYFQLDTPSPYMLLIAKVRKDLLRTLTKEELQRSGLEQLHSLRSDIPAVTHVDNTARIQTVNKHTSPRFHRLISAFHKRTGYGVILNTSFNIRGEPIVCTPQDAYRCFMFTNMDALVLGNCLLMKSDQPPMTGAEEYQKQFKLD